MVDPIKELRQIDVNHDALAVLHMPVCCLSGIPRTTAGPEPIAVFTKSGIDQRLQRLQQRLLNQTVDDNGNAQFAFAVIWLGDADATHRTGPIRACHQLLSDVRQRGPK
jgi:hypothetical protein